MNSIPMLLLIFTHFFRDYRVSKSAVKFLASATLLCTLTQSATAQVTLPYATDFEASDNFVIGDPLGGDWGASDGSIVVTDEANYSGQQSVRILGAIPEEFISLDFVADGNSVLFADYYVQLTASSLPALPLATDPETTAAIALQLNELGVGAWAFLDGDNNGNGSWVVTRQTAPLNGDLLTNDWHRVTLRLNLASNTWDVSIDEKLMAVDIGFYQPFSSGFEALNIFGTTSGVAYFDKFSLATDNPLLAENDSDADNDGMHDSYEMQYGLNTQLDDRNQDPDSDGVTNIREFMFGTDPNRTNIITVSLTNNDGLTRILEEAGNIKVIRGDRTLYNKPMAEVFGIEIIPHFGGNDPVGHVVFESEIQLMGGITIKNASSITFNAPVSVTDGNVSLHAYGDLIFNAGGLALMNGDLATQISGDILLENGSRCSVNKASGALGRFQLNSFKTITLKNNSTLHASNSQSLIRALGDVTLEDNSAITAEQGFVQILASNGGSLILVDSAMSVNHSQLFIQVSGSMHIIRGTIDGEASIVQFVAFEDATLEDSSSFRVNNSDLFGQINGNLTVSDSSSLVVAEGNLGINVIGNALVDNRSRLEMANADYFGDTGEDSNKKMQLIVSGTTTFAGDSAIDIENSELAIFSFDNIYFPDSTVSLRNQADAAIDSQSSIRSNGTLGLIDSTFSTSYCNLLINTAKSISMTRSDIAMSEGVLSLNATEDVTMDTGCNVAVTSGDLYTNVQGSVDLAGNVFITDTFSAFANGDINLKSTGAVDAFTVFLSSNRDIAINGRMDALMDTSDGDGLVYLNAQGSISMKSNDPISAAELSGIANASISLRTDVDKMTLYALGRGFGNPLSLGNYTGSGEIEIDEVNDVELTAVYNSDGPIRVKAGGTIKAVNVTSATDAPGHNVGLMSTGGNLQIGLVSAGTNNGQVSLSAANVIEELAPYDVDVDLMANMTVSYASSKIYESYEGSDGFRDFESNVNERHAFTSRDVVSIETNNDVELFLSTKNDWGLYNWINIYAVSLEGDVVAKYVKNQNSGINLDTPQGKVYLGDVDEVDVGNPATFINISSESNSDAGNASLLDTSSANASGSFFSAIDVNYNATESYVELDDKFNESGIDLDNVTYTVTNSNNELLAASVNDDGLLTVQFDPEEVGSSEITVTASEINTAGSRSATAKRNSTTNPSSITKSLVVERNMSVISAINFDDLYGGEILTGPPENPLGIIQSIKDQLLDTLEKRIGITSPNPPTILSRPKTTIRLGEVFEYEFVAADLG